MKKTALLIMIITLFSKIIGFGRDIVLSYYFGASSISDAYLISLTVPSVIFGLIGVGIVTAYIPMQSRVIDESGETAGSQFTSNFINIILIMTTIILIIGMIFTEPIVKMFAIGFTDETLSLTIGFTKISLFGMYFTALISIFGGFLQIKKNYIVPALVGIPFNTIVIFSTLMASKGNSNILALGTLIATASQLLLMLPFIKKTKFKYFLFVNIKDSRIIKTIYIAAPVIIGTSVNQINILVDRTIASSLAIGGISALNYASRLNNFIQGLFVTSIITAMYPMISSYASKQNFDGIKRVLGESINIITFFVLPITIGAMNFNNQVINFLFGRGAFDERAIQMTSIALFYYAIGMIGFGLREVLSRGFYSLQDTKTPMINSAIGMLLNIVLNIILSQLLGIGGLALATSISAIFTTMLLFISLRKKIGPFGMKQISISFLKILFASLVMGGLSKLSFNYLTASLSQNLSFLLAICVGVISYFVIIYFMKIEDIDIIVKAIKKKFEIGTI
ncbi:murein biosynthesis integral membrane protein MurJ [Fusibacter ferrireducens]|uniref:Probable lipid II flippase MurJ n=1 Tax=Fusibacter ferrireducens TaxID=2785058 RepID=A0ABR9ZXD7_9FIRM|nr:murein biosynthesis integral membrane protein MurJ [Fusibacter ferrireducens]MBF4695129.1 murein biosynthesis integral membrane protein MurJ [Fusibacter ferrireducens]